MPYADYTWYANEFGGAGEEGICIYLDRASDAIDALTFNRIRAIGWDNLTEFQRERVRKACCVQADFLAENADALDSALSSYAINGVSMTFGNGALYRVVGGVPVANAAMALIRSTGLATALAHPREVHG